MPKEFYTERDIEDMVRRGVQSLELNDDVVLTELAYEKAERLGLRLVRETESRPSAPVRPYLSDMPAKKTAAKSSDTSECPDCADDDLTKRVREAVIARLGQQVDPVLLDTIIRRVLTNVGLK